MKLILPVATAGLAAVLATPSALAADLPALYRELAQCRALQGVAAKAACYEAIPIPPASSLAAPGPGPARPPAAGVQPAQAAAAAVVSGFGLPAPAPAPAAVESIESRIEGRFDGWSRGSRLRLANGQVWEVTDSSTGVYDLSAPVVRIKRGVLGSFFIEIDGISATPRVKRVQ